MKLKKWMGCAMLGSAGLYGFDAAFESVGYIETISVLVKCLFWLAFGYTAMCLIGSEDE